MFYLQPNSIRNAENKEVFSKAQIHSGVLKELADVIMRPPSIIFQQS